MFEQYEQQIREMVRKAHAPVLGLLGGLLPADARVAIASDVRATPGTRAFLQRLDEYPALFAVWLAEHVMHGLGNTGHFDVYPHVQKALGGVGELNNGDRERLWRGFRRAMFKLGVQPLPRTSGTHYMIDEYARQAGVPLAFADELALRMLALAKRLGVPDEDDQEGLLTWQLALLNKLQLPFSTTARRAVERDAQAYYTRAFVRVHANHGQPTPGDALEAALARAFVREGAAYIKRALMPQLLYRDGAVGVLFPPTPEPARYELRCGSGSVTVRADEQGAFRHLPDSLPSEVQVLGTDGERALNVKLWSDRATNRLLVFNEAGRLRASAQLGQQDPVELSPGRYVALCRFEPTNVDNGTEVCEDPRLVEVSFELRPGARFELANGPARVCIDGQDVPTLEVQASPKASLEHVELLYGPLVAHVEIPPEWRQAGQEAFEVRVNSGDGVCRLPLRALSDGTVALPLSGAIEGLSLGPGLRRLVVELSRAGDARTLQRQSVMYWVGLTTISYGLRFQYLGRPTNLVSAACSGFKFGDTQAEPESSLSRVMRLAFDIGAGRLVHLSWNRPGLFVEVELPGVDGASSLVSRPLGATETVSLSSAKNIIVSGSEPGYLAVGAWRQFVDFGHRPTKTLSASFLASRLEPGERVLTFETESGGAKLPLLVLSQPHVVSSLVTSRIGNVLEVRVILHNEPTEVAVTAKNLASGHEARAEHALMAGTWHRDDVARMQVYSAPMGTKYVLHVLVDAESLAAGVWTLTFGAKIAGAWGRLEDAEEGRIAVAVAVDSLGQEVPGATLLKSVGELELPDATTRLSNLSQHFQQFWSPSCWEQQSWLSSYWTALVELLRGHESDALTQLVDSAVVRPDADVRQGFVPKQSVGAQLPAIFALRRDNYRRVNSRANAVSVVLRAMPELKGTLVSAFGATLHPAVAVAFRNAGEVFRGLRPKGFGLKAYVDSLRQTQAEAAHRLDDESFLPGPGELLGPLHLAHAWRDLERGYDTSLLLPSARKTLALSLCRTLHQRLPRFDDAVPAGLRGQPLVLELEEVDVDLLSEAEQQRRENLVRIANACAWFAWYCRLESRRPGELHKFNDKLQALRRSIEVVGHGVPDCLAFYLHVAPALFAYYLLLWELVLAVELDPVVQHV